MRRSGSRIRTVGRLPTRTVPAGVAAGRGDDPGSARLIPDVPGHAKRPRRPEGRTGRRGLCCVRRSGRAFARIRRWRGGVDPSCCRVSPDCLGDLVADPGRVGASHMHLDGWLRLDRRQRLKLRLLDERPDELPHERGQDDERATGDLEGLLVADVEAVAGRRPHHERGERLDQDRLGSYRVPLGHDTDASCSAGASAGIGSNVTMTYSPTRNWSSAALLVIVISIVPAGVAAAHCLFSGPAAAMSLTDSWVLPGSSAQPAYSVREETRNLATTLMLILSTWPGTRPGAAAPWRRSPHARRSPCEVHLRPCPSAGTAARTRATGWRGRCHRRPRAGPGGRSPPGSS